MNSYEYTPYEAADEESSAERARREAADATCNDELDIPAPNEKPHVQQRELAEVGGCWIDTETGEVLGIVGGDLDTLRQWEPCDADAKPIMTEAFAKSILRRQMDAAAELAGIEAKRKAINANLDAIEARIRNRAEWLGHTYGEHLEAFAATRTTEKRRSWGCEFGRVGFRKSPGSVKVGIPSAALTWAKEHAPQAVKVTESVLTSALPNGADLPAEAFIVTPPADRFYIRTGVE